MGLPVLDALRTPDDVPALYTLMEGDDQYLFSTRIHHNTVESFGAWLQRMVDGRFHDFFVVRVNGEPVGYAHSYDFSLRDGRCQAAVCVEPAFRATGAGAYAALQLLRYLFATYPLRKVYTTIYDYNAESLRSNLAAGFVEEGVLEGFRYHDGGWHGLHYLSMDRATFEERFGSGISSPEGPAADGCRGGDIYGTRANGHFADARRSDDSRAEREEGRPGPCSV